jgi:hypothetical protein
VNGKVYDLELPLFAAPYRHRKDSKGRTICRTRAPQTGPYNLNWSLNRWTKHEMSQTIVDTVMIRARNARIPKCERLTVQLHWAPGDDRSADSDNLAPSFKHACDALARPVRKTGKGPAWKGLHLVPDDKPEFMRKLEPVIHPGTGHKRLLWLRVCTCTTPCDHHRALDPS